jgi:uncharacterized iron-regulated protein
VTSGASVRDSSPIRSYLKIYVRVLIHSIALGLWLCLASCAVRSATERGEGASNWDGLFWRDVEKADVIYFGETHDDSADHRCELDLVRGLLRRKIRFAIGWEMFDVSQQGMMDAWASHTISLTEMLAETDFQKHWGIYSPAYEEMLQMAGKSGVPNLALNASPELPRKVARGESLTAKERAMIPTGFAVTEKGYRNFVAMMGGHPAMHEADLRRFFEAQNIWDQTMASRILEFKAGNPKILLVVLTGRGHVSGGYGIPYYVRQKATLEQIIWKRRGDRTDDPMCLQLRLGKFVPIVSQSQGNSFLRVVPRIGNRHPVLWPYFANRPVNSSTPGV